jgi:hypothetical protein
VHCQIETLRRCFPQSIKRALNELPRTLDETYDRTLQDIDEEKQGYTYLLFQCLTVSIRPLRLKELVEVLAIQLDAETMPGFDADWRPEDAEEAVMSACSTLVTIVEDDYSKFVQFSHFTVKEYLISSRLANSNLVSHYHIPLLSAHTFLARACLCILLQLDDTMDRNHIEDFPLAQYAARYWIEHAQFESVSKMRWTTSSTRRSHISHAGSGYTTSIYRGGPLCSQVPRRNPMHSHCIMRRFAVSAILYNV